MSLVGKLAGGATSMRARDAELSNAYLKILSASSFRNNPSTTISGAVGKNAPIGPAVSLTLSGDATSIKTIKEMAKSDIFQSAALGVSDDRVRGMVRDGKIPPLPKLTDDQRKHLSREEDAVYAVVSTLQDLYGAQPKSLQSALDMKVKTVLETYPEMIARDKAFLDSGKISEEEKSNWREMIKNNEDMLTAAQQGRFKIQSIDDPKLMRGIEEYDVRRDGEGWIGSGQKTVVDNPSELSKHLKTEKWISGSSPYTGAYAITWS